VLQINNGPFFFVVHMTAQKASAKSTVPRRLTPGCRPQKH